MSRLRAFHHIADFYDAQRDRIVIVLIALAFLWLALQQRQATGTAHNAGHAATLSREAATVAQKAADEGKATAQEAKHDTELIQAQRVESIELACADQNRRNHHTIAVLNKLSRKAERKLLHRPAARVQLHQSIAASILLIDALAPAENCKARTERFAGTASGPPGIIQPSPTKGGELP